MVTTGWILYNPCKGCGLCLGFTQIEILNYQSFEKKNPEQALGATVMPAAMHKKAVMINFIGQGTRTLGLIWAQNGDIDRQV